MPDISNFTTSEVNIQQNLGPYARAATDYYDAGWNGPLPLRKGTKNPPPERCTGYANYPTREQIATWCVAQGINATWRDGNIAIRMPDDVIGIDVDTYNNKHGDIALAGEISKLGELPATFTTTARGADQPSRIHWFRVPPGLKWAGKISDDIEIISWHNRYAMVWPSIHPNGSMYRSYRPSGEVMPEGEIFIKADLAELPTEWIQEFSAVLKPRDLEISRGAGLSSISAHEWLDGMDNSKLCNYTQAVLDRWVVNLGRGSRHEAALQGTYAIVGGACDGHRGIELAVDMFREAFFDVAVGVGAGFRTLPYAESEFKRLYVGAIDKFAVKCPDTKNVRPCVCGVALPREEQFISQGFGWFTGSREADCTRLSWRLWRVYKEENRVFHIIARVYDATPSAENFPWDTVVRIVRDVEHKLDEKKKLAVAQLNVKEQGDD